MEKKLRNLFKVIIEEIEYNEEFKNKVYMALEENSTKKTKVKKKKEIIEPKLNPLEVILDGENELRSRLLEFEVVYLKDIIKFYNMDSTNSSSRWKKKERLINYIVDVSKSRANIGNAFRG